MGRTPAAAAWWARAARLARAGASLPPKRRSLTPPMRRTRRGRWASTSRAKRASMPPVVSPLTPMLTRVWPVASAVRLTQPSFWGTP